MKSCYTGSSPSGKGGTRIGGIAISKTLMSLGFVVQSLIITDIREEA